MNHKTNAAVGFGIFACIVVIIFAVLINVYTPSFTPAITPAPEGSIEPAEEEYFPDSMINITFSHAGDDESGNAQLLTINVDGMSLKNGDIPNLPDKDQEITLTYYSKPKEGNLSSHSAKAMNNVRTNLKSLGYTNIKEQ